ncbi:MAG: DUF4332 domain-containing protein [Acidovorax sp.]|uniref:DUF4332 domain-containing protein n=1 Tax=Acidovorax sp. TaxID=1872122 RepID=UPI00391CFA7C
MATRNTPLPDGDAAQSSEDEVSGIEGGAAPVIDLLGIGAVAARALARIKVLTTDDLLRARSDQLAHALQGIATPTQTLKWRYAASLVQVRGVGPHVADLLVRHNVFTPDELGRQTWSQLQTLLAHLPSSRAVTADQAGAMLRDATVLSLTGRLAGTVRDAQGKPVRNAVVALGGLRQTTNTLGRFDLRRVPLGRGLPLEISHARHQTLLVPSPTLQTDPLAGGVQIFTLQPAAARPETPAALSEWAGDTLPVPCGQPVRERMGRVSDLREGDLLRLNAVYANGSDVKLVSRFKTFEAGVFWVHVYRVSASHLPARSPLRQHFRWRGGSFAPVDVDLDAFHRESLRRRMLRHFASQPLPATAAGRKKALEARLEHLAKTGAFQGRHHPESV